MLEMSVLSRYVILPNIPHVFSTLCLIDWPSNAKNIKTCLFLVREHSSLFWGEASIIPAGQTCQGNQYPPLWPLGFTWNDIFIIQRNQTGINECKIFLWQDQVFGKCYLKCSFSLNLHQVNVSKQTWTFKQHSPGGVYSLLFSV